MLVDGGFFFPVVPMGEWGCPRCVGKTGVMPGLKHELTLTFPLMGVKKGWEGPFLLCKLHYSPAWGLE